MNTLHQQRFIRALTAPESAIPTDLFSGDAAETAQRFEIYRNNVRSARTAALRQIYPVLERLLGSDYFTAVAAVFVASRPPRSPALHHYGEGFGKYLLQFPALQHMPWLGDVAQLEAARVRAFHAANRAPVQLAETSDTLAAQLEQCLVWHPSVTLLAAESPVFQIWHSQMTDQPMPTADNWRAETVLIWRQQFELRTEPVSALCANLLNRFGTGCTLAEAMITSQHDNAAVMQELGGLLARGCLCIR